MFLKASRHTIAVIAALASAGAAFAQPSMKEKSMAGNVNCDDYKSNGDGSWTGKDGKTHSKTSSMAVAIQQKCTGKTKQ